MPRYETDRRTNVVVVIAAYNEARVIGDVVRAVLADGWPVVVVDDGSVDQTFERLAQLPVWRLRHIVNRGQGAALQTGIRHALSLGAEVVVTFDADGQHDPSQIIDIVEPVASGRCDVAMGSRFLDGNSQVPFGRYLVLKLGVLFTRVTTGIRVTDTHNGFRAFSREAAERLSIVMDRMAHGSDILEQVARHRWRFCEIPVTIKYTAYSIAKGQRSGNALRIAIQVLLEKMR
ncbi:MAG: glycosyltransferase family 2 protein [Acidobacteriota bacterium]|nr:glycosyltransferase family 2 protein [Acidobacteriota bacterium]